MPDGVGVPQTEVQGAPQTEAGWGLQTLCCVHSVPPHLIRVSFKRATIIIGIVTMVGVMEWGVGHWGGGY